jgi:hypothetical protein
MPKRLFILLVISFCFSCGPENEAKHGLVDEFRGLLPAIIVNDSALFHGIDLGMNPQEIKKNLSPTDSVSMEEADYLFCEGKLGTQKEYTYECSFNEKGLFDLTLDLYLKDEENATVLLTDFRTYFNKKYGPPLDSLPYYIWEISGKHPAILELEEEADYGYGKLRISFYDQAFDDKRWKLNNDSLILE